MKKETKKRVNRQDSTLRNIRAGRKAINELRADFKGLRKRFQELASLCLNMKIWIEALEKRIGMEAKEK